MSKQKVYPCCDEARKVSISRMIRNMHSKNSILVWKRRKLFLLESEGIRTTLFAKKLDLANPEGITDVHAPKKNR